MWDTAHPILSAAVGNAVAALSGQRLDAKVPR